MKTEIKIDEGYSVLVLSRLHLYISPILFGHIDGETFLNYLAFKSALDDLVERRFKDIKSLMDGYNISMPLTGLHWNYKNHPKAEDIEAKLMLIEERKVQIAPLNFISKKSFHEFISNLVPGAEPMPMNRVVFISKFLMKKED